MLIYHLVMLADSGTYVHIFHPDYQQDIDLTINNHQGILVVDPDYLVACTTLANSFDCVRRSVIQSRVRSSEPNNSFLVYGNIMHACFQAALAENRTDAKWLEDKLAGIVSEGFMEDLYSIGKSEKAVIDDLKGMLPNISAWFAENLYHAGQRLPLGASTHKHFKVYRLLDIEERIWSTKYGLKGNIDATLQVINPKDSTLSVMPFELKTGKRTDVLSHRTQMMLYSLMLSDKYNRKISNGMLTYLTTSKSEVLETKPHERNSVIQGRNLLVQALGDPDLPPVVKNSSMCSRCSAAETCMVYHKAVEGGDSKSAGVGTLFSEKTEHLKPAHVKFIKKWEDIIAIEDANSCKNSNKDIWTHTVATRVESGS